MKECCDKNCSKLSPEVEAYIEECKGKEHTKSFLISVLHKVQEQAGYLPQNLMEAVAERLQIPTSKIYGVATFYHLFKLNPVGKHTVNICLGTACYVKGAQKVLDTFESFLKIKIGNTTEDNMFTLTSTRCVGTCGLAPVVMVDDKVYSKVTPDDIPMIIAQYCK